MAGAEWFKTPLSIRSCLQTTRLQVFINGGQSPNPWTALASVSESRLFNFDGRRRLKMKVSLPLFPCRRRVLLAEGKRWMQILTWMRRWWQRWFIYVCCCLVVTWEMWFSIGYVGQHIKLKNSGVKNVGCLINEIIMRCCVHLHGDLNCQMWVWKEFSARMARVKIWCFSLFFLCWFLFEFVNVYCVFWFNAFFIRHYKLFAMDWLISFGMTKIDLPNLDVKVDNRKELWDEGWKRIIDTLHVRIHEVVRGLLILLDSIIQKPDMAHFHVWAGNYLSAFVLIPDSPLM